MSKNKIILSPEALKNLQEWMKRRGLASRAEAVALALSECLERESAASARPSTGLPPEPYEPRFDNQEALCNILDLSELESGEMTAHPHPFRLRNLLKELAVVLEPELKVRGLELEVVVDDTVPELFCTDRLRLRQILFNLLSNAVKFAPGSPLRLQVSGNQHQLEIHLNDQGPGLSPEALERLRKRLDLGSKMGAVQAGTPLGLTLAYRLSHLLKGSLWFTSATGSGGDLPADWKSPEQQGGSHFWVRLLAHEAAPRPSTEGLHILVAEDNRVTQRVIRETLNQMGHRVHLVGTGKACLEALELEEFSLVLMDLQMPEMDGLEATRRIRARFGALPRVIALTAQTFPEDREQCFAVGMDDFLAKPVSREDLKAAIERVSRTAQPAGC